MPLSQRFIDTRLRTDNIYTMLVQYHLASFRL
jgi:hypothetical protein